MFVTYFPANITYLASILFAVKQKSKMKF